MSTDHTPNYQLSQWEPDDQFVRTDFNEDNAKIDAALLAERSAREAGDAAERSARQSVAATIPKIKVGTYTGDGEESRIISVGFTPKAVYLAMRNGQPTSSGRLIAGGLAVTGGDVAWDDDLAIQIVSGGFRVICKDYYPSNTNAHTNYRSTVYHYLAIG